MILLIKQQVQQRNHCRLYNVTRTDSVDQARYILFSKTGKPESLCPTQDAFVLHLKRVHYQTMVWRHADCAVPTLPNPVDMGWKLSDEGLQTNFDVIKPHYCQLC